MKNIPGEEVVNFAKNHSYFRRQPLVALTDVLYLRVQKYIWETPLFVTPRLNELITNPPMCASRVVIYLQHLEITQKFRKLNVE